MRRVSLELLKLIVFNLLMKKDNIDFIVKKGDLERK